MFDPITLCNIYDDATCNILYVTLCVRKSEGIFVQQNMMLHSIPLFELVYLQTN